MAGGILKNTGVIAKDSTIKKQIDTQNSGFIDREKEIKNPQQDENTWKTRMLKIHNKEITLKYADPTAGMMHSEMNSEEGSAKGYKIEGTGMGDNIIELEEGITVTLEEPVSILETHTGAKEAEEGADPAGSVYLMSPAGKMTFDLSKIKGMEDMETAGKPVVNLGMFQITANFNANGTLAYGVEISAYLRDSLKAKKGSGRELELVQGEYQKKSDGNSMLKFADSYLNTNQGKVNLPEMREIHFQEDLVSGKSSQTTESYYYKSFAATEVQLKNIDNTSETLSADLAKTEIFGFPAEMKNVSISDSEGKMKAKEAGLLWRDGELKLEDVQVNQIPKIYGMQVRSGAAILKQGNREIELQSVHMNKDALEAESARMQYDSKEVELSDVKIEDTIQANLAFMKIGEGTTELRKEAQKSVEIAEEIFAPTGEMELYKNKLSMKEITINKGLELSANETSTEVDGFFTRMTRFHYSENGEASYDYGSVLVKLKYGKKEDSKDTKDSKIREEQQVMLFTVGKGKYNGSFEEETRSTGFWATGNIAKKVVQEGTSVEETAEPETGKNQEKINILKRLKEKWGDKKKEKKERKAPKIITNGRLQEKVQQEIYTLDGFAKVTNATFDFVKKDGETKVIGEGDIKFLDIPFRYDINKVIRKPTTAFAPEETVKGVEFTIDSDENLNAVFEDDAEAEFNLKGVNGKENSGEGTKFAITLGGFSIQNGYLKAGSASLERGLALEQEGSEDKEEKLYMKDEVKKFFDCTLTGSMVNESEKDGVNLTTEGIEAHLEKAKLGKFGVSGFMGFLNGEVDFRAGKIAVSAEKEYEPKKLQESFFSLEKNTKGLDATIPTPIPGVGVAFNITPFVGISGAVGVGVELGESFDTWKKDSMNLSAIVEGKGQAGITVGAGVNLGVGYIASVDLKLEGGLSASIEGTLEGKTAFKFNKEKNAEKKMEQSEDLTFDGSLKGTLTGALNLNSTAKFFFWKKQLFNFELWKKELGEIAIKGTGRKQKVKPGLLEGWEITSGEFKASWLSKEITRKYFKEDDKGIKDTTISEAELETLVTNENEEAKEAWAVLCKLQAQKADNDTAIIISEDEKEALDAQIEDAKKKLATKCDKCLTLLIPQKSYLDWKLQEAKKKLAGVTEKAEEYAQAQGLAGDIFQKAQWGGFNKEKYAWQVLPEEIEKPEILNSMDEKTVKSDEYKKKFKTYNELVKERNAKVEKIEKFNAMQNANASIDLMITYMLGQVSKENIAHMQQKHMEETHMGMEEYIEHLKKSEAEKLQKKADELQGYAKELQEYKNKRDLSDLEWRLKNNYEKDYYMSNTNYLDTTPEYKHQNNYYSMLKEKAVYKREIKAISHWQDDNNTYEFKRTKSDFPMKLWSIINSDTTTMEDILKHILTGNYEAKEKLVLIKKCFTGIVGKRASGDDSKSDMIHWGKDVKKGLFERIGNMYGTIFQDTEDHVDKSTKEKKKAKLLEEVVKGKKFFDIFKRMEELNDAVVKAADEVATVKNEIKEAENARTVVQKEITEYQTILEAIKRKASVAVAPKNFSSDAAKETIRLYSKNYVEKMQGDVMEKELDKKIEANKLNATLPKSIGKL